MKKLIAIITVLTIISCALIGVNAKDEALKYENTYGLNDEVLRFLEKHNVEFPVVNDSMQTLADDSYGANSYNLSIASLINSAEAYGFTDKQIQEYVDGLVNTPTIVARSDKSGESLSSIPESVSRPGDNGIGWEVTSKAQFCQATAYATLPKVTGKVEGVAPYMFFTILTDDNWNIDMGVGYESGDSGLKWRGYYTTKINGENKLIYDENRYIPNESYVYFDASVIDVSEQGTVNQYLRFRVLDGNNFSKVYYDISYFVGDKGITRTNASFIRQITLCDGSKRYNTGTTIKNAKFSESYLYSTTGYSKANSTNCVTSNCGRFGTNNTNVNQVTVNSYKKWYEEDISISF